MILITYNLAYLLPVNRSPLSKKITNDNFLFSHYDLLLSAHGKPEKRNYQQTTGTASHIYKRYITHF